jgi:hypothetical protein
VVVPSGAVSTSSPTPSACIVVVTIAPSGWRTWITLVPSVPAPPPMTVPSGVNGVPCDEGVLSGPT